MNLVDVTIRRFSCVGFQMTRELFYNYDASDNKVAYRTHHLIKSELGDTLGDTVDGDS